MISNFFEIFLLSIVQGISEFLPISSAAHLILVSNIYEFKNQSLLIDISLHLGSLLAILFYFRKDIFDFRKNLNLFYKIAISTMPLVVVGYFLYSTEIIYQLRNIQVIAWSTLFFGILIYIADKNIFLKKIETDFNIKSALIIGFFQVIALIPGASRAGITITAGRILGFNRVD
jgi:undecaprenyl-diphosphatase